MGNDANCAGVDVTAADAQMICEATVDTYAQRSRSTPSGQPVCGKRMASIPLPETQSTGTLSVVPVPGIASGMTTQTAPATTTTRADVTVQLGVMVPGVPGPCRVPSTGKMSAQEPCGRDPRQVRLPHGETRFS